MSSSSSFCVWCKVKFRRHGFKIKFKDDKKKYDGKKVLMLLSFVVVVSHLLTLEKKKTFFICSLKHEKNIETENKSTAHQNNLVLYEFSFNFFNSLLFFMHFHIKISRAITKFLRHRIGKIVQGISKVAVYSTKITLFTIIIIIDHCYAQVGLSCVLYSLFI